MIAPAIADVLGLGERQGSSAADSVLSWLADREVLLVLDNCEHLLDGVVVLLERLLAGSPRLVALATSRARLLVPFERVFPVSGLSVEADDGGPADAVRAVHRAGSGRRYSGEVRRLGAHRRHLQGPRWNGAGDRAGRRPVSVPGAGWARNWIVRSVAAAERRPADRRPAPFAALDARLELCTAGRTRAGGAASGLGFRRPVHRDRSGGGSGRLAASAGAMSPPSWPGSPTRVC